MRIEERISRIRAKLHRAKIQRTRGTFLTNMEAQVVTEMIDDPIALMKRQNVDPMLISRPATEEEFRIFSAISHEVWDIPQTEHGQQIDEETAQIEHQLWTNRQKIHRPWYQVGQWVNRLFSRVK